MSTDEISNVENLTPTATFDDIENRITNELIEGGEIQSKDEKRLYSMMLQCFEEFNSGASFFNRDQIQSIWNILSEEQKHRIIDGLNADKPWY